MQILAVSGSRADHSAIYMVTRALDTAGHRVETCIVSRTSDKLNSATATAQAMRKISELMLDSGAFDLAVIHGDRHEIAGAALALNIQGVPIAHIGGGDLTQGSQDDCFRHAITKLSHLHFPSNLHSGQRIIQMGERPCRVHIVGCPGIDYIAEQPLMDQKKALEYCGLPDVARGERFILVLHHPDTLHPQNTADEANVIKDALWNLPGTPVVIIGPNSDDGWRIIHDKFSQFAEQRPRTVYCPTLVPRLFLSLMAHCSVMVGNSSSMLYEASYFGTQCVNIGDRQHGRYLPINVASAPTNAELITGAIRSRMDIRPNVARDNYYGDGKACGRIVDVINRFKSKPRRKLLEKPFGTLYHLLPQEVFEGAMS